MSMITHLSLGIMTSLADEHVILGNYNMGVLMAKDAMDTANHSGEENNIYSAYAGIVFEFINKITIRTGESVLILNK